MPLMPTPTGSLQRAIRQTQPFRSPGHEAVVALLFTADILKRRFAAVLEPHRVTGQQYNVLRILRGAGPDGIPTLEVAERMIEEAPGITRLVDRLEKQGWVRRDRGTEDRRQVLCRITATGLKLLAGLDAPVAALEDAQVAALAPDDRRRLLVLLEKVRG
jgi:DNA-binding MarR family transcriptional regulator